MQDILHSMSRKLNVEISRICDQITKDINNGIPHPSYQPPSEEVLRQLSSPYEDILRELQNDHTNINNNNYHDDDAHYNNNHNTRNSNYENSHSNTRMSARLRGEKVPEFSEMDSVLDSITKRVKQKQKIAWALRRRSLSNSNNSNNNNTSNTTEGQQSEPNIKPREGTYLSN